MLLHSWHSIRALNVLAHRLHEPLEGSGMAVLGLLDDETALFALAI